ncbi:hypothetical protein F4677DRAFT_99571 [Hypoxylon crocopeplum]|nr:hypothetical protein F4677DRAFT_99571 [Hypoxylon crocopeplum]
MASILTILFLFTLACRAQFPDKEVAVPADFPKAFITAMAVAIVCVVVVGTFICVFAHCWQYILGPRKRGARTSSSLIPERWLEPVFEWPQQLTSRSRNNRKRKKRNMQRRRERRGVAFMPLEGGGQGMRRQSREGMLRGWV